MIRTSVKRQRFGERFGIGSSKKRSKSWRLGAEGARHSDATCEITSSLSSACRMQSARRCPAVIASTITAQTGRPPPSRAETETRSTPSTRGLEVRRASCAQEVANRAGRVGSTQPAHRFPVAAGHDALEHGPVGRPVDAVRVDLKEPRDGVGHSQNNRRQYSSVARQVFATTRRTPLAQAVLSATPGAVNDKRRARGSGTCCGSAWVSGRGRLAPVQTCPCARVCSPL